MFSLYSRQRARAAAHDDPKDAGRPEMAAADARYGYWPDGAGMEPPRGAPVSGPTRAAALGCVSPGEGRGASTSPGALRPHTTRRSAGKHCPPHVRPAERPIERLETGVDKPPRLTHTVALHDRTLHCDELLH